MSIDVKKNKVLVIGGGILAVLIAVAGFFLWKFSGAHKQARQQVESLKTELATLNGKKPTPKQQNVQILDNNIAYLNEWNSNYVGRLFSKLPPPPRISPSQFQEKAVKELGGLEVAAADLQIALGEPSTQPQVAAGPDQPEEEIERFYFAFERYTEEGKRPLGTEIPRLALQLAVVQDLVNILFDITVDHPVPGSSNEVEKVHINRIHSVQRQIFEKIDDALPNQGLPPAAIFAQPSEADEIPELPLYDLEQVAIGFRSEEQHIWKFLNRVNELKYPAIVSRLRLKNGNELLQPFTDSPQKPRTPRAAVLPIPGGFGLPTTGVEGELPLDNQPATLNFISGDELIDVQVVVSIAKPHVPTDDEVEGLTP